MTCKQASNANRYRSTNAESVSVEAIIGLFILTIILLSGAQLFRVHVEHLALVERARRADEQAHITMNTLAAFSSLPCQTEIHFRGKGSQDTFAEGEPVQLDPTCASHKRIAIAS